MEPWTFPGAITGWVLGPAVGLGSPSCAKHGAAGPTLAPAGEPGPLAVSSKHLLFTNDLAATSFPLDPAKSRNSPWQLMVSQ